MRGGGRRSFNNEPNYQNNLNWRSSIHEQNNFDMHTGQNRKKIIFFDENNIKKEFVQLFEKEII